MTSDSVLVISEPVWSRNSSRLSFLSRMGRAFLMEACFLKFSLLITKQLQNRIITSSSKATGELSKLDNYFDEIQEKNRKMGNGMQQMVNINEYYFIRFIMRQGKNLILQAISQWRDSYIDYQYLKIFIQVLMKIVNETTELQEIVHSHHDPADHNNNSPALNQENIQKISRGLQELQTILVDINKLFIQAYENESLICQQFCVIKFHQIEGRFKLCQMFQRIADADETRDVLIIYTEYAYIEAAYLKKMEESNLQAERKILKKHKKYALKMVQTPEPMLDNKMGIKQIKKLNDEIEDFYVHFTFSIDEKRKKLKKKLRRKYLRSLPKQRQSSNKDTFIFGLWVGIFVAVIIFMSLLLAYEKKFVETDPIFNRDFPTWRGIAFIIFYIWVLGLNVFCFEHFMISYGIILDFRDHHTQPSTEIFKIAGLLSTIFAAVFTIYALHVASVITLGVFQPQYLVLIVWGVFIIFMFNPLPILYHNSRIFTLKLLFRILASPFVGVPFVVSWATDQLVSLITPFEDMVYTGCYYFNVDFTDLQVKTNPCRNTAKTAVFIFASSVFIYRILQCVRQGYDKKKFWKQLQFFNSIKYLFSLLTIILSYLWKNGNQNIFAAWLVFAIVSTLYSYLWDLKVDWALLGKGSDNCLLRDKLTYNTYSYYFMMVSNLILRLAWVLTLSPNVTDKTFGSPEIFRLVTGALEIIRRGIWNILRIEKEHIKNCQVFKALPTIQLQYESKIKQKIEKQKDRLSTPTMERINEIYLADLEGLPNLSQKIQNSEDEAKQKNAISLLSELRERISEVEEHKKEMIRILDEKKQRAFELISQLNAYSNI